MHLSYPSAMRCVLRDAVSVPSNIGVPMPRLACWACGRQIYTVSPIDSLDAEERRCTRCGSSLDRERRESDRRATNRRQNPADDPGPPDDGAERREADRRTTRRRTNAT
jgi:hypothetical protein